jgi:hypothetical protein
MIHASLLAATLFLQSASPAEVIATQVAGMLGGRCWPILSFSVQVRGRPFCQNTAGTGDTFEAGRRERVAAVKALGLTFALFIGRHGRQSVYVGQRQRLEQLERVLSDAVGTALRLPSTVLHQTTPALQPDRRAYQLSFAVLAAYGDGVGAGAANALAGRPDPVLNALAARTTTTAGALERSARDATAQIPARDSAIATGGTQGAEALRLAADARAGQTFLGATLGVGRVHLNQLQAYRVLKKERTALLTDLSTMTLLRGVP